MTGAELYDRYLQGNNDALDALVIRYGDSLAGYAYCFLHDFSAAEDVMEDTFATLIVKRKRFASGKTPFEAYLFRIARNKCIDRLRKQKRELPWNDEIDIPSEIDIEEDAIKSVRDGAVYKALFALPKDYRDALYLMYYQGFSADEIHIALHKSKKQVYNLLARGKSALKQILIKEGIGYEDI